MTVGLASSQATAIGGNEGSYLLVIGTRPEAIKLAPVVRALQAGGARVTVVNTGQHREMLDPLVHALELEIDYDLDVMRSGQSLAELASRVLAGLGTAIQAVRPDVVVVQGDTTSAFAGAMSAYYERIPVAHVEAGLRSGAKYDPYPEEGNRQVIGQVATWHFAPTHAAASNLVREGVAPQNIHVTGNTVIDNLLWARRQTRGRSPFQTSRRRVLVTMHRRENQGATMRGIASALARIAAGGNAEVVLPMHRSPAVRQVVLAELQGVRGVTLIEPLDYFDFVAALDDCDLVLTDSGGVQEEAPSLAKPVLVLRRTTERPEGIAAGTAKLIGVDPDEIVCQVTTLLRDHAAYAKMARVANPYGDGFAAERIVDRLRDYRLQGVGTS